MKTKFVIAESPTQEPVQELLLSLDAHGGDAATIMLHLPSSGRIIPLVGVSTDGAGKLVAVRWSTILDDYVSRDDSARIVDRFRLR